MHENVLNKWDVFNDYKLIMSADSPLALASDWLQDLGSSTPGAVAVSFCCVSVVEPIM